MPVTRGMIVYCNADRAGNGIFQPIDIDENHPIHNQGKLAPLSPLIHLPFKVYRHFPRSKHPEAEGAALDNSIATYLMIERNGFAAPEWLGQAGTVTVMRLDGVPLTRESMETIWMYFDHLLDVFGDDPGIAQSLMTQTAFQEFCKEYKDNMLLNGREEFNGMELPL